MHSFTTLLAVFATLNAVNSSPILNIFARDTCGSAPSASGSQTPIEQPSNIQNAAACQSACDSSSQCQSFVFGMVDNTIKCMLFSVPASQVPKQSTNLVVYDKACSSVPSVTPTSDNPTGASNSNNNQGNNNNNQNQQGGTQTNGQKLAVRDTCGATPSGSGNQSPINQPANINSAADCLAQCKANPSCKSFEFGTDNGAKVCKLFSVAAANVPPPSNGQSLQVFDVGCSV